MYQNRVKLIGKRRACKEVDAPVKKTSTNANKSSFPKFFMIGFTPRKNAEMKIPKSSVVKLCMPVSSCKIICGIPFAADYLPLLYDVNFHMAIPICYSRCIITIRANRRIEKNYMKE